MTEDNIQPKRSKKVLLLVLGGIVIILALGLAYWFGLKKVQPQSQSIYPKTWTEEKNESTSDQVVSQIDPQTLEYEEYQTEDKQLTVKYPKDWIKSVIGDITQVVDKKTVEKYHLTMPLLVSKSGSDQLLQITLSRYEFNLGQTPNQIIEQLMTDTQNQGVKAEITARKSNDRQILVETKYQKDNLKLQAKEKLLLGAESAGKLPGYIISFNTLEKDYQKYLALINYIIDSAIISEDLPNIKANDVGAQSSLNQPSDVELNNQKTPAPEDVKQSNFLELMLAKIPQGASAEIATPAPTSEFSFPAEQFCVIGLAKKAAEKTDIIIYQKDSDIIISSSSGPKLGEGQFKHCRAETLKPGQYQLEMVTNFGNEEKINFSVK